MIKISTPRNARHIKQKDIFCPSIMQGRRLCLKSSYLEANQGDLFFLFFLTMYVWSPHFFGWLLVGSCPYAPGGFLPSPWSLMLYQLLHISKRGLSGGGWEWKNYTSRETFGEEAAQRFQLWHSTSPPYVYNDMPMVRTIPRLLIALQKQW